MLVNKFPLHIPLPLVSNMNSDQMSINSNNYDYEDDLMMMDELTPVSTPVDQVTFKDYSFPEPPRCGRTSSVSSIASSISNISTHNDFSYSSFASHYKLTQPFEELLLQTYQDYQTNPTITPFNESNPPSGVLAKVSKDALKTAVENGIEIGIEINNYSLTIIRQKLIQLCHSSSLTSIPTSRTNSVTSLNNYPSLNLANRFNSVSTPSSGLQNQYEVKTPVDSYFSFEAPPTPPQYQQQQSSSSLQPSFLQEPVSIQSSHPSPSVVDIPDGLFNATSNRKRESLRLKRSGNKPTYN